MVIAADCKSVTFSLEGSNPSLFILYDGMVDVMDSKSMAKACRFKSYYRYFHKLLNGNNFFVRK
jgi:hypothetical protein